MTGMGITITFLSEWQVASGLGDGFWADSVLHRGRDGLPSLPGGAIRGALREAAAILGRCRGDLRRAETLLWGTRAAERDSNESGVLRVSPGLLPADIREAFLALDGTRRAMFVRDMTCRRTQTALGEDRQVRDGTLRKLECGMPGLAFESRISAEDIPAGMTEDWIIRYMTAVCAAMRSMGGGRSRGLGRCAVRLAGAPEGPVRLPEPLGPTGGAA